MNCTKEILFDIVRDMHSSAAKLLYGEDETLSRIANGAWYATAVPVVRGHTQMKNGIRTKLFRETRK